MNEEIKEGEVKKKEDNKADNKEIDRYEKIVDRANKEIAGVRHVYMWLASILGIIFVVGMGIATFITYTTIGDIKSSVEDSTDKLEKRVGERIEEQFDQNNIQELVEEKAQERIDKVADTMIGQKIEERVTPLISDVNTHTEDLRNRIVTIEQKINQIIADSEKKVNNLEIETEKNLRAMQSESKFLLTVLRAQNGDKQSWLELGHIAEKEQGTERGNFATGAFRRIYDDFFKTGFQMSSYYLPSVSDSEVVANLKDKWAHKRRMAVYTIKQRKMYNQIPTLISMLSTEENLDVLAEIYRVLNEFLGTDINITDNKSTQKFEEAWDNKKKQLEETKEKNN